MSSFIILAILLALIVGLGVVLVLSQRQFDQPEPALPEVVTTPFTGPPPLPPPRYASGGLSALVASTIEAAGRSKPRNSDEAQAVETLRSALQQAVAGDFRAEVALLLDDLPNVTVLHDVVVGGPTTIAHLAVGARGVTVIDSVVRTGTISCAEDGVFVGRGDERYRDPMIDSMMAALATVAAAVDPVPVHGLIVLRDVLAVPEEIRSGAITIDGVRLATVSAVPELLVEPGPVNDRDLVVARLRDRFEPALPPVDDGLRPIGRR